MYSVKAGLSLQGRLFLLFLLIGIQVNAQTFPLKVKDTHLVTKNQSPFLINGRSADIYGNFSNEIYNLQRYSYLAINTVLISVPSGNAELNKKGQPTKEWVKKIKLLRRFTREASLYNIAVFVAVENPGSSENSYIRNKYLQYAFKTMYRNKNVTWILNRLDNSEAVRPNKNQLIAERDTTSSGTAHFFIQTNSALNPNGTKPLVLLTGLSDSSLTIREAAYAGIMKGAAGIINQTKANTIYSPASQQLKQWATTFDSIPWTDFTAFPGLIDGESGNLGICSVTTRDSLVAAVYFRKLTSLHLNLSLYKPNLKLTWINTVNGKMLETVINPVPDFQIFMPPLSDDDACEWLLIMRQLPSKNINN